MATGKALVRPKLAKIIGPHAVQFDHGTTLDVIDDIIMATGFRADYSFCTVVPPVSANRKDKTLEYIAQETPDSLRVELYKGTISLSAPDSLAFIGRIVTPGLLPTIAELQSRYLIELYRGNVSLPNR